MEPARTSRRGVIEVAGPEARALLHRLVTNDVEGLSPGETRYAALLTPQGKILVDFFIVSAPDATQEDRFLIDCPAELAADLTRRLTLYKLRAKVSVTDRSEGLDATPLLQAPALGDPALIVFADPRHAALGLRAIGPHDAVAALRGLADDVTARRIEAGVPEGGVDFLYNDAFPHEANLDRTHGVDFNKGCYVGQEVVSRMQHRGTARKRVLPVWFEGEAPAPGTGIFAADLPVGTTGSSAGTRGLALVRTDRVSDAVAAGTPLLAAGRPVRIDAMPVCVVLRPATRPGS